MSIRQLKVFKATLILTFVSAVCIGQESGYLAQKMMVENDLRTRIADALSKVIEDARYVVDVSVELEVSDAVEEQVTVVSGDNGETVMIEEEIIEPVVTKKKITVERESGESLVGLPIPGFEFETDKTETDDNEIIIEEKRIVKNAVKPDLSEQVTSKTSTYKRPAMTQVRKQEISIILQEGVAPELIENIRQVVMVATRFNRSRGDVLSIMTASFKERRDEKTAEQVLLSKIAQKLERIEAQKQEERSTKEKNWQEEIQKYRDEELKRRENDRAFFKAELENLEASARERAFQSEKREILRRDSLKLSALNQEIESLKKMLGEAEMSETEVEETETEVERKEREKEELDTQIASKITELENVQTELNKLQGDMNSPSPMMIVLLALFGALLLILLVVAIVALMGRSKQHYPPPPPWMYPPRKKKKKKTITKKAEEPGPTQVAEENKSDQNKKPNIDEDPAVLKGEIDDIKQAVVSLSVGQPGIASRIVNEWMEEGSTAPEEAAESEESEKE